MFPFNKHQLGEEKSATSEKEMIEDVYLISMHKLQCPSADQFVGFGTQLFEGLYHIFFSNKPIRRSLVHYSSGKSLSHCVSENHDRCPHGKPLGLKNHACR